MKTKKPQEDMISGISISGGTPQISYGDDSRNVQVETYNDNSTINVYQGISPRRLESQKLQAAQALVKKIPLLSIPSPSARVKWNKTPKYAHNRLFIGREEEFRKIAALMKGEKNLTIGAIVAINGMGGLGKTQLASEFAHRYGQYFAGGVYWLDFSNQDMVKAEIATCGHLDESVELQDRVDAVLMEWLSPIPRLLIFDNCEDIQTALQWRPPSGGGRVIITTRQSEWGVDLGIESLSLETFSRKQSIEFLNDFKKELDFQDPILDAIAGELGDLPLALHMAGSYLQHYRFEVTPAEYLQELRKAHPIEHCSMENADFSPTNHNLNVGRTFSVNIETLQNKNDEIALLLLELAACFSPGEWIPRPLLINCLDISISKKNIGDGLRRLLGVGLIRQNEIGDLWMHRLVAGCVQFIRIPTKAHEKVVEVISNESLKINTSGNPLKMQPVFPHLTFITENAAHKKDEKYAMLANILGNYLQEMVDFSGAKKYYESALNVQVTIFGEDHPETAKTIHNLGKLFQYFGYMTLAKDYFERSLSIRKRCLGENHPDTAVSLNSLGDLFTEIGNSTHVKECHEKALTIFMQVYGEIHPDVAKTYSFLGIYYRKQGDLAQASFYYKKALKIKRQTLGEYHSETALGYNNVGFLYRMMGNYVDAKQAFEQSLLIRKKIYGEEHTSVAKGYINLGGLLKDIGNLREAKKYYELAIKIRKKYFYENHPLIAKSYNSYGTLLRTSGNLKEAEKNYKQALIIRKEVLGEKHPDTATTLDCIGELNLLFGDYSTAEKYINQALDIRKKQLGENHPDTATSINNIGILMYKKGCLDLAEQNILNAIKIRSKEFGEEHPLTACCFENLGLIYKAKKDFFTAKKYNEMALCINKKIFGDEHYYTATSLNNKGELLREQGENLKAKSFFLTALEIRKKVLGEEHPDTAGSLNNLGTLLQAMGDLNGAKPYYEQALAILEKKLGVEHPDTKLVWRNLEMCKEELSKK